MLQPYLVNWRVCKWYQCHLYFIISQWWGWLQLKIFTLFSHVNHCMPLPWNIANAQRICDPNSFWYILLLFYNNIEYKWKKETVQYNTKICFKNPQHISNRSRDCSEMHLKNRTGTRTALWTFRIWNKFWKTVSVKQPPLSEMSFFGVP